MATIQIINNLKMQWEKGYSDALIGHDVEWSAEVGGECDLRIFMWCDDVALRYLGSCKPEMKSIFFMRRYEYYAYPLEKMNWDMASKVIVVNDFMAESFKQRTGVEPVLIYNSVIAEDWTYKPRSHGKDIAWVGFINQKKNIPIAIQIMSCLPENYKLHVAGGFQDAQTMDYLFNIGHQLRLDVRLYDQVDHDKMDAWLEDKNYIMNTSISEGCPNSVIEAMAKGIMPVVHAWPGAHQQFGKFVFRTVQEALNMMNPKTQYPHEEFRNLTKTRFGPPNFQKFRSIVDEVLNA